MTDLDTLLNQNIAPAPRAGLADHILETVNKRAPANDGAKRQTRWWSGAGIAAMALIAGVLFFQPGTIAETDPIADAEHWEQIADSSGFSELYAWVEDDNL